MVAYAYRSSAPWRPSFRIAEWRPILRQAVPLGLAGAIYSAYFRVVILIMSIVAVAVETGYFALSFRVVEVLVGIPFLVTSAFIPIFSRAAGTGDDDRLAFAMSRTFDVAVLAGAGLTLLTFAGAPLAMAVLTGDPHSPATDVLRIQSFTLLAVFVNAAYGTVLVALRRHRDLVTISAGTLAATAVLAGVLVPLWDATGGAIASVAGEWLLTVAGVIALRRAKPDVRVRLGVALKAVPAALVAGAVASVVDVPHLPDLGPPVVAGLVYATLVVLLRGVPRELTDALLRRGGRSAPTSPA
jgi:O-antigen/teichoic acid export membrane protein